MKRKSKARGRAVLVRLSADEHSLIRRVAADEALASWMRDAALGAARRAEKELEKVAAS